MISAIIAYISISVGMSLRLNLRFPNAEPYLLWSAATWRRFKSADLSAHSLLGLHCRLNSGLSKVK